MKRIIVNLGLHHDRGRHERTVPPSSFVRLPYKNIIQIIARRENMPEG